MHESLKNVFKKLQRLSRKFYIKRYFTISYFYESSLSKWSFTNKQLITLILLIIFQQFSSKAYCADEYSFQHNFTYFKRLSLPLALFTFTCCYPSSILCSTEITHKIFNNHFTHLEINNDRGKIDIIGVSDPFTTVSWSKMTHEEDYGANIEVEKNILKLINNKKRNIFEKEYVVDWEIKCPSNTSIRLNLGTSTISFTNLTGQIYINLGSGKLFSNASLSNLIVNAGEMEAEIHNLEGDSLFDLGFGNLKIFWRNLPSIPRIITFNFGNVKAQIKVPEESSVNLDDFDTTPSFFGFGGFTKSSEVQSNSSPHFTIRGKAGVGKLKIHKNVRLIKSHL